MSADKPVMPPTREWPKQLCLMLAGGWICATIFMFFVANNNFAALKIEKLPADRVEMAYGSMPTKDRPMALKYCANELNRQLFTGYGYGQLVPAVLCLIFLSLSASRSISAKIALFVALVIALLNIFWITPAIVEYGGIIEFLPRNPIPAEHAESYEKFKRFHGASFGTYFLQLACVIFASLMIIVEKKEISASS